MKGSPVWIWSLVTVDYFEQEIKQKSHRIIILLSFILVGWSLLSGQFSLSNISLRHPPNCSLMIRQLQECVTVARKSCCHGWNIFAWLSGTGWTGVFLQVASGANWRRFFLMRCGNFYWENESLFSCLYQCSSLICENKCHQHVSGRIWATFIAFLLGMKIEFHRFQQLVFFLIDF